MVLRFFAMRGQQGLERREVDLPIDVQAAERAFKVAHGRLAVEDLNLGDQTVEPQPYCGVRDAVGLGQLLERARGEHEPFEKREVLVFKQINPSVVPCHH